MKKIKFILIILLSLGISGSVNAQILKKIKEAAQRGIEHGVVNTVERKLNQKSEEKTEEAIDAILGGNKNEEYPNIEYSEELPSEIDGMEQVPSLTEEGSNEVGFIRGSKILYSDDFSRDAIGDFPAKWNTSIGGEVKKLSGFEEKWLRVPAESTINLEITESLPPNFTVEFDLIMPAEKKYRIAGFGMGTKPDKIDYTFAGANSYGIMIYSQEHSQFNKYKFGVRKPGNANWNEKNYTAPLNKIIRVAIEVNNHERVRTYIDGEKMSDAPLDFKPEFARSVYFHAPTHGGTETKESFFYVSNFVIAEAGIDERSQVLKDLLEYGSFTTSAIYFESGSDEIDLEQDNGSSWKILSQIGEAIQSLPDAKFEIIGHTDSDGSEKDNQALSESRAISVRDYFVNGFLIDKSIFVTSGKGETEPVADNSTTDGKAANRRVEFRRM